MKSVNNLILILLALIFLSNNSCAQEGTLKWKFATSGRYVMPPAIGPDGTIYLTDLNYSEEVEFGLYLYLYALNPDGTVKWSFKKKSINGIVPSYPTIGFDGTIYLFDDYGLLIALNPDGSYKWDKSLLSYINKIALGSDGLIFISSNYESAKEHQKIIILDSNGILNEEIETGYYQPYIGFNKLIYTSNNGTIKCINSLGEIQNINSSDPFSKLISIGKENRLYVAGSSFRALTSVGSLLWEYPLSLVLDCVVDNTDVVYVVENSNSGYIWVINPDGTLKWKYNDINSGINKIKSPCIGLNDIIYFVNTIDGNSYIYALNSEGKFLWKYQTDNTIPNNSYPMLDKNGSLYILDSKGVLSSIQTSSYGYQKGSPWPCYGHDNGHTFNAGAVYTSVDEEIRQQENTNYEFSLIGNYPNPFNSSTTISFSINKPGKVEISVYNLQGQKVAVLNDSYLHKGNHSVMWDAVGYSSGIYLARLQADNRSSIIRMLLIK